MTNYRVATSKDATSIAHLHAISWQKNYRGSFGDHYLDHEVQADRLQVWTKRLTQLNANQHIIVVEENKQAIGFVCVYLNEDPNWGALLDNLHVLGEYSGRGIGKDLMKKAAEWVQEQDATSLMYLWVLAANKGALRFYKRLGGINQEKTLYKMMGAEDDYVYRIVWEDLSVLIE